MVHREFARVIYLGSSAKPAHRYLVEAGVDGDCLYRSFHASESEACDARDRMRDAYAKVAASLAT